MTDTKSVVREVKEVVGYFALVLAIFAMFSWFLNMKVIPVFAELCHAIDVPSNYVAWHTFQVSEAVGSYWEWYTAGAGLLALVVALTLLPSRLDRTFAPSRRVRKMLSEFALRTPLVGRLAKSANLATSMQMLAQLLKAGVPLDVALDDAASASINPSFAAAFGRMRDKVRQGMALSKAAESEWWFIPKAVAVAMANAEYHGDLAGAMQNLAMFYRAKTFRQMKMIKPLLLPLVVLVLGSLVLIQYTSIFIGLMNMGERIMGGM